MNFSFISVSRNSVQSILSRLFCIVFFFRNFQIQLESTMIAWNSIAYNLRIQDKTGTVRQVIWFLWLKNVSGVYRSCILNIFNVSNPLSFLLLSPKYPIFLQFFIEHFYQYLHSNIYLKWRHSLKGLLSKYLKDNH